LRMSVLAEFTYGIPSSSLFADFMRLLLRK
jgi:hypothetical protein